MSLQVMKLGVAVMVWSTLVVVVEPLSCPCPDTHICILDRCVLSSKHCPDHAKFGPGPPAECPPATDPNNMPPAPLEKWFTKEIFDDLFPKANIGWGPHTCSPYSYESFIAAVRYFPEFGNTHNPDNGFTAEENYKRDLATFFSHAVQETGENDASLYKQMTVEQAHSCFYRGGFFNWFEGGPVSSFMDQASPGFKPEDGDKCNLQGKYCSEGPEADYWFPCNGGNVTGADEKTWYKGCYFGRGAIQISYNYNYGYFNTWLNNHGIYVDLLTNPNLVITHRKPPLAVMASLWFYMTPQPPKPAMHDIVMGHWESGDANRAAGYSGAMFGPTSLIINAECNGEDEGEPGGPGESRRIKAYKWFAEYFGYPIGDEKTLSCNGMPVTLERIDHPIGLSYQPDWQNNWKEQPCECAPAKYGGLLYYYNPGHYPAKFAALNELQRLLCIKSMYDKPAMYRMDNETSVCLNHRPPWSSRPGQYDETVLGPPTFSLASRGADQWLVKLVNKNAEGNELVADGVA